MSTVQFNLLPDVKMTYVKAQRSQKLITSVAVLLSGGAIAALVLLFVSVNLVQKKQLGDANKDIVRYTAQLKKVPSIDDALTSQNQLSSLTGLHDSKHMSSRLFTYLDGVSPPDISFSRITLDFSVNKLVMSGKASSAYSINKFVDTLRFTQYKMGKDSGERNKAFNGVTETDFSIKEGVSNFEITTDFNPVLFSNDQVDDSGKLLVPELIVPNLTTTHADTNSNNQGGR